VQLTQLDVSLGSSVSGLLLLIKCLFKVRNTGGGSRHYCDRQLRPFNLSSYGVCTVVPSPVDYPHFVFLGAKYLVICTWTCSTKYRSPGLRTEFRSTVVKTESHLITVGAPTTPTATIQLKCVILSSHILVRYPIHPLVSLSGTLRI
jgi:hypothetical protein